MSAKISFPFFIYSFNILLQEFAMQIGVSGNWLLANRQQIETT